MEYTKDFKADPEVVKENKTKNGNEKRRERETTPDHDAPPQQNPGLFQSIGNWWNNLTTGGKVATGIGVTAGIGGLIYGIRKLIGGDGNVDDTDDPNFE